jgi:hypothetical protein
MFSFKYCLTATEREAWPWPICMGLGALIMRNVRLSRKAAGSIVLRYVTPIGCMFFLVACATITKGTTQTVAVDTPGVPAATCTVQTQSGPQVVTTPGTVTLNKGSVALPIQCTKECYLAGSSIIPSGTEAMAAGNVLFGGVVGLGVDAMSGAMNKYPDMVTVAMTPDQTCRTRQSTKRN